MDRWHNEEPITLAGIAETNPMQRREFFKLGIGVAGVVGTHVSFSSIAAAAQRSELTSGPLDTASAAKKIAFDRIGNGEKVLLISGFPQTRRSWNRLIPLLSAKFQLIPADLPSFGDSEILSAPATTENVARVFHEFVGNLGAPLHVVAHDFGAWCAYSWALLFPDDFKSLTLIEAGIPGITLLNDIQLSDYKRKWNFIFQMLPDLPAELTKGKEDIYVGWWFKNKVYKPGAVPPRDIAAYVAAYAREGRMDAAFDYCRRIVDDMEFNKKQFTGKLPIRLLAVGGQYSIPTMGESLQPYFQSAISLVIPDAGHFVPEEQPEALAKALVAFLSAKG
ncbi:alpha/beta fold hydrolase [Acidicapsa acidisoli]|uniref:alpha/beta fold hydrolase n=1 Tax=Acidicapsa acidisoli TaxID=1615681 RepID=UPI0021DF6461|nr:alpha/beta fold hydrolase [Acidicapsa acidisoli]